MLRARPRAAARGLLLLVTIAILAGLSRRASAVALVTSLDDLNATSSAVVIARVTAIIGPADDPTGYQLAVERVLRGSIPGPILVVHRSAPMSGTYPVGERLVAFVDQSTWLAAGAVIAGPSLEEGVLRLLGFEDLDIHLIEPGVMTLSMLESYLGGAPQRYMFRGPIMLAGATGPTPSSFEITATGAGASWTVSGLPASTFPAPSVPTRPLAAIVIEWKQTSARTLVLEGVVTGKHSDGAIAVRYWLVRPRSLTERALERYLRDEPPARAAPPRRRPRRSPATPPSRP